MIIGRENEQRELCKLHGSSMLIRPRGKCLLFLPQYIEHKISKSNEISIRMNEQKNILERLAEVIRPFKTGLNALIRPNFSLLEAYCHLINVKYVKNEVFENNFEQF